MNCIGLGVEIGLNVQGETWDIQRCVANTSVNSNLRANIELNV